MSISISTSGPGPGRPLHVGPFELGERLGEGGMGVVFEASRAGDPQPYAVKIARAQGDVIGAALEVQAAARLNHAHIVGVEAWGEIDRRLWVAMPRLSGETLTHCLLRMPLPRRLQVMDQLLDALTYAHDRGVVHRDLKPENVIVETTADGTPHAWLMDFGIAALSAAQAVGAFQTTMPGASGTAGTPSYMAPEQVRGGLVGPEADLYAVGVLLFLALTGHLPFEGPPLAVLFAKTQRPAPPVPTDRAHGLGDVVARLLETHPLDRYPCASAVRAALAPTLAQLSGDPTAADLEPRRPAARAPDDFAPTMTQAETSETEPTVRTPEVQGTGEVRDRLHAAAHATETERAAQTLTLESTKGLDTFADALSARGWQVLVGIGSGDSASSGGSAQAPFRAALQDWVDADGLVPDLALRLPDADPAFLRALFLAGSGRRSPNRTAAVPAMAGPDEAALVLALVERLAMNGPVLLVLGTSDPAGAAAARVAAFVEAAARRLADAPVLLIAVAEPRSGFAALAPVPVLDADLTTALGAETVDALQRAALLGPAFSAELLEAVGAPAQGVAHLQALGILAGCRTSSLSGKPGLRFAQASARLAIRGDIAPTLAATVHRAAVQWLDTRAPQLDTPGLLELSEHSAGAAQPGRALAWLHRAGRRAESEADLGRALSLYRDVLDGAAAHGPDHVDHAALLLAAARVAHEIGAPHDAQCWCGVLLALDGPPRTLLQADAHRLLAEIHRAAGDNTRALWHLGAGLDLLGPGGDRILRALLLGRRGWLLGYVMGRNDEGRRDVETAFGLLQGLDVPAIEAQMCSHLGAIELRAGRWDQQTAANQRALALSEQAGDTPGRIRSHINLGVCHHNRGHLDAAAEQTLAAAELAALAGADTRRVIALNNLGLIRLDQDRLDEATESLEASAALAERCGARDMLFETLGAMARVAVRRGDLNTAWALSEQTAHEAEQLASPVADAHALRVRAVVEGAFGRPDLAVATLTAALRLTDAPGAEDAYESAVTRLALGRSQGEDTSAVEATLRALGAEPQLEAARWVILSGWPRTVSPRK